MNGSAKGILKSRGCRLFKQAEVEIKIKNPKYKLQAKIQILFDDLILEKFIVTEPAINITKTTTVTQLNQKLAEFDQLSATCGLGRELEPNGGNPSFQDRKLRTAIPDRSSIPN